MEMIEQIQMWEQLYWEAMEDGLEPDEAEQFANRILSMELQRPVHLARNLSVSRGYASPRA